MLPSQEIIDRLATRIERAFTHRCNTWYRGCSTPRVWSAGAMILLQVSIEDPEIPIDPELFVASQPVQRPFADPWNTLAIKSAGQRYRLRVRRIIRQLRLELKREIRRAEDLVTHGRPLAAVVHAHDTRLSPLGRYITAQRARRPDLAESVRFGAIEQHNCCPLYRAASLPFLAAELYPAGGAGEASTEVAEPYVLDRRIASLN